MKLDLPIILTSILNGGLIRIALVAFLFAVSLILTIVGFKRKDCRSSMWLLYIAGISFLFGVISGTANGLHTWTEMERGAATQANPVFEFLAGLMAYTLISIIALIGSLITRILNQTPERIG